MPAITALIHTRFRKRAAGTVAWLQENSYESLFLALPTDLEKYLKSYTSRGLSLEDLWRSYGYLTGVQLPFIKALRYTIDPIIEVLPHLMAPKPEIYCYQDTESSIEATKLSERTVILELKGRMGGGIDIGAWRALLRDELDYEGLAFRRSLENIAENAINHPRNVVLSQWMGRSFRSYMETKGFAVETIYLKHYWRSPLEALKIEARLRGVDSISEDLIMKYIQEQLRYLAYILNSKDLDEAHEKWTMEMRSSGRVIT